MAEASGRSFARCEACHGLWLPRRSIEANHPPPELVPAESRRVRSTTPSTKRRECPFCTGALRSRVVRGFTIDECRHCRGVWLDAGEYDAVFAYLATLPKASSRAGQVASGTVDSLNAVDAVISLVQGLLSLAT